MNLFGKSKPKAKAKGKGKTNGKTAPPAKVNPFSRVQVISKPEMLNRVLKGIKEQAVMGAVSRIKLKAASLVSGRGEGTIYNYSLYNFKSGPKPVMVVNFPRSTTGGNFVPADNPMEPGEAIEVAYSMPLAEAEGNTLYFNAAGVYVQTAFYLPNAKEPAKPWVGSKEATEKKFGENAMKQADEVLQVRIDKITVYPTGPESFTGDQIAPYVFKPQLHILAGGGVWAKRGGAGYFESIPDPLEKYLEKVEEKKLIGGGINLVEFGVDTITVMLPERLLPGIDHDSVRPSVLKKPNDNLQIINSGLGFLLKFEIADEIKELMMRTYPQKVGKEVEIWLPLTLGQLSEAEPPKERAVFQLFPRDLTIENNPARRKKNPGVKFVPPFTLHPNAEDHNTYRKLMVAMGQRMKDDSRPDEEKNKLASVQASVAERHTKTRGKYVDENMKKAFSARQEARKRKDAQ